MNIYQHLRPLRANLKVDKGGRKSGLRDGLVGTVPSLGMLRRGGTSAPGLDTFTDKL